MEIKNIIAVYNQSKYNALQEFSTLMDKTSSYMNDIARTKIAGKRNFISYEETMPKYAIYPR